MVIVLLLLLTIAIGLAIYFGLRFQRANSVANDAAAELRTRSEQVKKMAADGQQLAQKSSARDAWCRAILSTGHELVLSYTVTSDDTPHQYWEVNEAALRQLGYTREEFLAISPLAVEASAGGGEVSAPPRTGEQALGQRDTFAMHNMQMLVRRILREQQLVYEASYITKGGKMLPVEITASRLDMPGRTVVLCVARDTSERARLLADSREKTMQIRDLINRAPVGIALYDAQKQLVEAGPNCHKILGFPDAGEFKRFNLLDNAHVPKQAKEVLKRGESIRFEMALRFDDMLQQDGITTSRRGIGHFEVSVENLGVDLHLQPRGLMVHLIDITALRETETTLRARERMLHQAQKLEAIGTFAGGIAHDFNNILTPIMGYSELAMDACAPESELHDFLRQIMQSCQRAKRLVEQILLFSRQTEEPTIPIRVTPIVKEIVKHVASSAPRNTTVQQAVKTDRDRVLATPTQLHQILSNLCTNAMYAMRETGGVLEVRLTDFVLSRLHRHEFPQLVTTDYLRKGERTRYLRITVKDSGTGMKPETVARIFEPFFTTKPPGVGTGMGLSVLHTIVMGLGGAVAVESELGKGTVFHVALPAVEEVEEVQEAVVEPTSMPSGRALFVDNEVSIVQMARHMLKSLGFEAVAVSESPLALQTFRQNPNAFDIVISDQVMPDMSGLELAKELLATRPDIPIILCTGYTDKVTIEEIRTAGIRDLLYKPVERRELAAAISRVLGAPVSKPSQETETDDQTIASN